MFCLFAFSNRVSLSITTKKKESCMSFIREGGVEIETYLGYSGLSQYIAYPP